LSLRRRRTALETQAYRLFLTSYQKPRPASEHYCILPDELMQLMERAVLSGAVRRELLLLAQGFSCVVYANVSG
jgi:hypothetical protein